MWSRLPFLFVIAGWFWAVPVPVFARAPLADVLARELSVQIKTRPAPVTLYSYHHRPTSAADLIVEKTARFHQAYERGLETYVTGNGERSVAIPGFYAAVDPIASVDYGGNGEDWRLIEFRVEKLRYLELSHELPGGNGDTLEFPLSAESRARLKAAGCPMSSSSFLFLIPQTKACGEIASAVLKRLRVDAILYSFSKGLSTVCPRQAGVAFLFVSTAWMKRARFTDHDAHSRTDLPRLRKLYDLGTTDPTRREIIERRRWPDVAPAGERETLEWIKGNLFQCGDVESDTFSPRVNDKRDLSMGM